MIIVGFLLAASGLLAVAAVGLFVWSVRQRTHEHNDRLSLLPLDD